MPRVCGSRASTPFRRGRLPICEQPSCPSCPSCRLVVGDTWGNGTIGEDITHNLRTIPDILLALKGDGYPKVMEVRGEVYMLYAGFKRVNAEREKEGSPPARSIPGQRLCLTTPRPAAMDARRPPGA